MARLSLQAKKELALNLISALEEAYPDLEMTLNYRDAWELLVGGILGAQTTDEQVNRVTATLFADYPTVYDFAAASAEQITEAIRTVGLYRNKAKALSGSAKIIVEKHDGIVPQSREELLALPGVGPKVASLVRGDYYQIPAVVVDTHCGRISQLLGLADKKDPRNIELELMKVLPQTDWIRWGHFMVTHGREYCKARCRNCLACPLAELCQYPKRSKVKKELVVARLNNQEDGCF
ncbi:MAG: endonuclease III domain-containing protein [Saccharofermentanales bacterium]|jgi:endonuclease-3